MKTDFDVDSHVKCTDSHSEIVKIVERTNGGHPRHLQLEEAASQISRGLLPTSRKLIGYE